MKQHPWFGALASFLLLSCASPREATMDPTLPFEEVLSRVSLRNSAIVALEGEGSITIETPEGSQSGSFTIDILKPDSLKLQLRGPFGIRISTLAIAPGSFVYYDSRENVAITGVPDRALIESATRISMDGGDIIRALTGEFPMKSSPDSLIRFYPKGKEFVLAYRDQNLLKEYRIDGTQYCVSSYREVNGEGNVPMTAFASRFIENGDVPVPTVLQIVFPQERRSVSIAYDDITLNGSPSCHFRIPVDARVIRR